MVPTALDTTLDTRSRLERLPAEIIDLIVEMCWHCDMKDDDHRFEPLSSFCNPTPVKVWLLKNRIFSLSQVARFLHRSCQRFFWNVSTILPNVVSFHEVCEKLCADENFVFCYFYIIGLIC